MQRDTYRHASFDVIDAIKANNEKVLKQFYQEEFPKTEKYVLENKGSAEQAKDIFQEAFIAIWRNVQLSKFKPQNNGSLAAYLYQVAKNKWIDYLRSGHYKHTVQVNELPDEMDITETLTEAELNHIEAIKNGFKQLGDQCRELLNRFYYQNETVPDIALAMEWTEATVRNNKYRCMERLRALLKIK